MYSYIHKIYVKSFSRSQEKESHAIVSRKIHTVNIFRPKLKYKKGNNFFKSLCFTDFKYLISSAHK